MVAEQMVIRDKGLLEVEEAQEHIGLLETVGLLLHQVIQVVLVDMVILVMVDMEQQEAAVVVMETLVLTVIQAMEQLQAILDMLVLPDMEQLPDTVELPEMPEVLIQEPLE
jgi:hypothetical protein